MSFLFVSAFSREASSLRVLRVIVSFPNAQRIGGCGMSVASTAILRQVQNGVCEHRVAQAPGTSGTAG